MDLNDIQTSKCQIFDHITNNIREVTVTYKLKHIMTPIGAIGNMSNWKEILYLVRYGSTFDADTQIVDRYQCNITNINIDF